VVNGDRFKRPHLKVISRVPGRHDRDWPRVPRALVHPAESVPAVPRSPPKRNLEKCQLFQKKVWYLGHNVSPEGITTDPEKLTAVWEWLTPKEQTQD
jgi:hypothetical protein